MCTTVEKNSTMAYVDRIWMYVPVSVGICLTTGMHTCVHANIIHRCPLLLKFSLSEYPL